MSAQLINRIADLVRFGERQPSPLLPFLVLCVLRQPTQEVIFYRLSDDILHLQGFISDTLARFFIAPLDHHVPFEKQLTASYAAPSTLKEDVA